MNDNDNIKELIGARLEEIHLSETMTDTMPSDEEILRWETLAQARRAQKQRNKRRLLSLAAVFLLAIVVGVAVIVSPPDAEAGGDGRAVMVGNEDNVHKVITYDSKEDLPIEIQDAFFFIDEGEELVAENIVYSAVKNREELAMTYHSENYGNIEITQIKDSYGSASENYIGSDCKIERWGEKEIFIIVDKDNCKYNTYCFLNDSTFVNIYCSKNFETRLKEKIGDAL